MHRYRSTKTFLQYRGMSISKYTNDDIDTYSFDFEVAYRTRYRSQKSKLRNRRFMMPISAYTDIGYKTSISKSWQASRCHHDPGLHRDYQYPTPTHELEFGLWVVTAWVSPILPGSVQRRGWHCLAGYKPKGVIHRTFPFNVAMVLPVHSPIDSHPVTESK